MFQGQKMDSISEEDCTDTDAIENSFDETGSIKEHDSASGEQAKAALDPDVKANESANKVPPSNTKEDEAVQNTTVYVKDPADVPVEPMLKDPDSPQNKDQAEDDVDSAMVRSESVSSHMSTLSTVTMNEEDSDIPLIAAARAFDIKAVQELLLDSQINVNQTTHKGNTSLHEMIQTYGNLNIVDRVMSRKKLEELVILLVTKGLDVNAVDRGKRRQTALHIIAEHEGNDDIIKTLLAVGMRVNLLNMAGETALHRAVLKVNQGST